MITQDQIYGSIDYKKTKTELNKVMGVYKLLLLRIAENEKPRVTQKFGLTFAGFTGRSSSSKIESYVIRKILLEQQLEEYIYKIVNAINKLDEEERKFIHLKYLSEFTLSDEQIQPQCHRYMRGFKFLKKEAYIKLAIVLGVEVYKEES